MMHHSAARDSQPRQADQAPLGLLLCRAGAEIIGLPLACIERVTTPQSHWGISDCMTTPVLDLATLVSSCTKHHPPSNSRRLLVVRADGQRFGVLVDSVEHALGATPETTSALALADGEFVLARVNVPSIGEVRVLNLGPLARAARATGRQDLSALRRPA